MLAHSEGDGPWRWVFAPSPSTSFAFPPTRSLSSRPDAALSLHPSPLLCFLRSCVACRKRAFRGRVVSTPGGLFPVAACPTRVLPCPVPLVGTDVQGGSIFDFPFVSSTTTTNAPCWRGASAGRGGVGEAGDGGKRARSSSSCCPTFPYRSPSRLLPWIVAGVAPERSGIARPSSLCPICLFCAEGCVRGLKVPLLDRAGRGLLPRATPGALFPPPLRPFPLSRGRRVWSAPCRTLPSLLG